MVYEIVMRDNLCHSLHWNKQVCGLDSLKEATRTMYTTALDVTITGGLPLDLKIAVGNGFENAKKLWQNL